MRRDVAGWLAFWASAGTLFYVAERRGWPLCGAVRHAFRSHTPAGKAALVATYSTGSGILLAHLLKHPASHRET